MSKKTVLILGGAGFIGSHIAELFVARNYNVKIIDGLMPLSGGRTENIFSIKSKIKFYPIPIEKYQNLKKLISSIDIIIDSMGFTSHGIGMENPLYDLELNLLSHLHVIKALRGQKNKKVIYIGSRIQYGVDKEPIIYEDTPMIPTDIQGVNKLAAENYFRIYSGVYGFDVVSLRISNCFGKNQKIEGKDIGLIASVIRDILMDKGATINSPERKRYIMYAPDLAKIIFRIITKFPKGFNAYNIGGYRISLGELGGKIIKINGRGSCEFKQFLGKDMGGAKIDDKKIKKLLGRIDLTSIDLAIKKTIDYFKEHYEHKSL
jgi:UDP-glucose 4-epimerase